MPMIPSMTPAQAERMQADREARARLGNKIGRDVEPNPLPKNVSPVSSISRPDWREWHVPADRPEIIALSSIYVAKLDTFVVTFRDHLSAEAANELLWRKLPLLAEGWKQLRLNRLEGNSWRVSRT